jgi:hypothetical protein
VHADVPTGILAVTPLPARDSAVQAGQELPQVPIGTLAYLHLVAIRDLYQENQSPVSKWVMSSTLRNSNVCYLATLDNE